MRHYWLLAVVFIALFAMGLPAVAAEDELPASAQELLDTEAEIAAKQQAIKDLDAQIKELEGKQASTQNEAKIISNKLTAIKERLARARLELRQTQLNISQVQSSQTTTKADIVKLRAEIVAQHEELAQVLRTLYERDQVTFLDVVLRTGSWSDVLAERAALRALQDKAVVAVQELRTTESTLVARQEALEQQATDLGQLQQLLSVQRTALADQEDEQQDFLVANKEQQVHYDRKLADAAAARAEIKAGVFKLQGAQVKLSLTNALDMARVAGKFTGVRPALLLGVLKIESNLGGNIGNGVFPEDMHPASREPFLRIMKQLGRDPATAAISAARSYGWGGAMGPAQIMPQTWEGIASRVGQYLHKATPDPYELLDAFVGTSIILGDYGAFDPGREREAAGRYLAGPNWQKYPWYIDRVMAVADEYEQEL